MAIVFPTNVASFLTTVKNSLTVYTNPLAGPGAPAPINFIRQQDLANVLRLFQNALSSTAPLTATGSGTTTTVVDGASTFVAGTMVGYTVTFLTGTAQNIGQSRKVVSNTTTTLTFSPALPAATATSDTYTLRNGLVDSNIAAIMENKDPSTTGWTPAYPRMTLVQDALVKLLVSVGGTVGARAMLVTTAVAGTSTTNITISNRGAPFKIDEFKQFQVVVGSNVRRRVIGNNETTIFLDGPITAPSGGETVTIGAWADDDSALGRCSGVLSGGQPHDNAVLGAFIQAVQTAIEAFTVPV